MSIRWLLTFGALLVSTQAMAANVSWVTSPQISGRSGTFFLHAEAEVDSPIENVLAASIDYNSYARKGVPTVRQAQIMSGSSSRMVVYFYNSTSFQDSTFFVNVRVRTSNDAARVQWSLANIAEMGRYRSNDTLEALSGEWKLTAVGPNRTHIVYNVQMKPKTNVPFPIVRAAVAPVLRRQVTALFQILAE